MGICYALINKRPLRQTLASFPPLLRSNASGESSLASDLGECIVSPTCRRKGRRGGGWWVRVMLSGSVRSGNPVTSNVSKCKMQKRNVPQRGTCPANVKRENELSRESRVGGSRTKAKQTRGRGKQEIHSRKHSRVYGAL